MADEDDDEGSPRVPIVCPACDTTARILLDDVAASLERHNERLHDGEEVARVYPELADHIADLVAAELDLIPGADGA